MPPKMRRYPCESTNTQNMQMAQQVEKTCDQIRGDSKEGGFPCRHETPCEGRTAMRPLPQTFREDGFELRVVQRRGNVALIVKSKPDQSESFEVVILQHRPAETIHGKHYPAREVMPRPEQWGICAWTPFNQQEAQILFQNLARKAVAS